MTGVDINEIFGNYFANIPKKLKNLPENLMKRPYGFPATFEESLAIFRKWFTTSKAAAI